MGTLTPKSAGAKRDNYRITVSGEKFHIPTVEADIDWFEFIFSSERISKNPDYAAPNSSTYISQALTYNDPHKIIRFAIRTDTIVTMCEALLERKVFSAPVFFDPPERTHASLDAIVEIISVFLSKSILGSPGEADLNEKLLNNIVRLIMLFWPNSNSEEIGLDPAVRPPAPLRQALDYICSKSGIILNVEEVADNSGIGLRTLESLFSTWLGLGIARYAKMTRMKALQSEMQRTGERLSVLAEKYKFSNVTRLRRDIADIDGEPAEKFDIRLLYAGLASSSKRASASWPDPMNP
jgi:AraC-like DNA-binding protein